MRRSFTLHFGISLALMLLAPQAAAQGFFCTSDMATGFRWNGSAWEIARFRVDKDRFVIRPASNPYSEDETYGVFRMGEDAPTHRCRNTTGDSTQVHLVCGGLGYGFIFRQKTMRFMDYYGIGYIGGEDNAENTPSLTIGQCVPLDD